MSHDKNAWQEHNTKTQNNFFLNKMKITFAETLRAHDIYEMLATTQFRIFHFPFYLKV
jgi:uncharacterized protein YehS (DUF1456 family)